MGKRSQTLRNVRFKRFQAVCCLVSVLTGPTSILPELLALGSVLEGSHTTYAHIVDGEFRLVLSHSGQVGRADFLARHNPHDPLHYHGLASRLLCSLAGSSQKLADHRATFSRASNGERSRRLTLSAASGLTHHDLGANFGSVVLLPRAPDLVARYIFNNPDPPNSSCLSQTTILLL